MTTSEKIFSTISMSIGLIMGFGILGVCYVDGNDTIGWSLLNGFGWLIIVVTLLIPVIALFEKHNKSCN